MQAQPVDLRLPEEATLGPHLGSECPSPLQFNSNVFELLVFRLRASDTEECHRVRFMQELIRRATAILQAAIPPESVDELLATVEALLGEMKRDFPRIYTGAFSYLNEQVPACLASLFLDSFWCQVIDLIHETLNPNWLPYDSAWFDALAFRQWCSEIWLIDVPQLP
jgi:hypothetical protein